GTVDDTLRAEAIARGAETTLDEVKHLAGALLEAEAFDPIGPMLVEIARRALYKGWEPNGRVDLAKLLRDHQLFGYARRVLERVRRDPARDCEELRQQHAICTYKDRELPAARALDLALGILKDGRELKDCSDAETFRIAGAILKRRW